MLNSGDGAPVGTIDPVISTPTTGQTVTITPSGLVSCKIINPAGTLATLTVTLANGTQVGQIMFVAFSQIVTILTVTATNVQTTLPLPTAAAVGQGLGFVWSVGLTKWVRFL